MPLYLFLMVLDLPKGRQLSHLPFDNLLSKFEYSINSINEHCQFQECVGQVSASS